MQIHLQAHHCILHVPIHSDFMHKYTKVQIGSLLFTFSTHLVFNYLRLFVIIFSYTHAQLILVIVIELHTYTSNFERNSKCMIISMTHNTIFYSVTPPPPPSPPLPRLLLPTLTNAVSPQSHTAHIRSSRVHAHISHHV